MHYATITLHISNIGGGVQPEYLSQLAEDILNELRKQLPGVLSRVGNNGQKIVIHIQPQASAARIELPPEIIELRRER